MNHFYQNIHGWFNFPNVYKMAIDSVIESGHFVEVGSWLGKSAAFMGVEIINSGKSIRFDCVDTWEGSDEHGDYDIIKCGTLYESFVNNMTPIAGAYSSIKSTSVEASKLYEDKSLDFVYIDASHDYDNVKCDILCWSPKVKPGGILAGHDYDWRGVKLAVDEILGDKICVMDQYSWVYRNI